MSKMQSRQGPQVASEDRHHIEPISVRISAAVKLTGIGRSTLYELIKAGELETVKVGRSTFIRSASRSEEHTSELQSLMRISYAFFCLKKSITYSKQSLLDSTNINY